MWKLFECPSFKHSQLLAILLRVEADRLDSCHNHHHAQSDRNKEHDDVFGSIFESQLLVLLFLAVGDHLRGPSRGRLAIELSLTSASACGVFRISVLVDLSSIV